MVSLNMSYQGIYICHTKVYILLISFLKALILVGTLAIFGVSVWGNIILRQVNYASCFSSVLTWLSRFSDFFARRTFVSRVSYYVHTTKHTIGRIFERIDIHPPPLQQKSLTLSCFCRLISTILRSLT